MRNRRKAVTLAELLLVLLIMALLIALAVPALQDVILVRTLESGSNRIESDIHLLREACRSEGCSGYWQPDADGRGYVVRLKTTEYGEKTLFARRLPGSMIITHNRRSNPPVAFNQRGEAYGYCTITGRAGHHSREVVVAQLGRIRQEVEP